MIIKLKYYFLVVFFLRISVGSFAVADKNDDWTLIKNENDIQVYIFKIPNQSIVKAKTKTIIKSSMKQVIDVLDDIDKRHEWVPFLKHSKALSVYENNKRVEYSHFEAPWPASDRDFVYQIELIAKSPTHQIYKMHSVASNLMPVNNDKVRADLYESIYTLTEIDNQTTAVELIFYADPKGWLPTWIINIIQRVLPFKILKNLKHRLTLND
ncbi:hypothetical protein MNBD_GAMMA07-515 [hydrothermal vent metagenome]|uniref:START domain-containing protein n=1 Tax=hydrothermal vent metagenome TaxID=652676 RepID=A0A3B0XK66_9ZZZZ